MSCLGADLLEIKEGFTEVEFLGFNLGIAVREGNNHYQSMKFQLCVKGTVSSPSTPTTCTQKIRNKKRKGNGTKQLVM